MLERITAGYIALFQGTPLLMQLFVVYYGLALIGLKLANRSTPAPRSFWAISCRSIEGPCTGEVW